MEISSNKVLSVTEVSEADCFAEELFGKGDSEGRSKVASVWVGGGVSLRDTLGDGNSQTVNRAIVMTKRRAVLDAR